MTPDVPVRVRIAPSPTGPLHVGLARTALFNYLFARHHRDGKFIIRIEDTDQERSKPVYTEEILTGLSWLGLAWDEGPDAAQTFGPYVQSERMEHYGRAIGKLLNEEKASVREGAVVFHARVAQPMVIQDLVRGNVQFPPETVNDFVIAKPAITAAEERLVEAVPTPPSRLRGAGKWVPLFHLAVVVDDAAMKITHVIRGEDHLSNTPKHILLQQALGLPTPEYAHIPLLLDRERRKLSKRTAETGLLAYRDQGYLPEAMVNFLALLGWNPKTAEEVFTLEELVQRFDLAGVQKAGAVFDTKKLNWLQREHLRHIQMEKLQKHAELFTGPFEILRVHNPRNSLEVWRDHGLLLSEFPEEIKAEIEQPELSRPDIPWRGVSEENTRDALRFAESMIQNLPETAWQNADTLQTAFLDAVDHAGWDRGTVLWPLRYALYGKRESPGPGKRAFLVGKEETLRRIHKALAVLQ